MNRHQGKHQSLLSVWCALGPGAAAGTVPRRSHAGSPPRRQRRVGSTESAACSEVSRRARQGQPSTSFCPMSLPKILDKRIPIPTQARTRFAAPGPRAPTG